MFFQTGCLLWHVLVTIFSTISMRHNQVSRSCCSMQNIELNIIEIYCRGNILWDFLNYSERRSCRSALQTDMRTFPFLQRTWHGTRGLILSIIVGTERRMAATHVIVLREQSLCQSEKSWLLCSTFPHKETTDSPCQSPDW
ncbi:hypothetical protein GOODEAATRI_028246 [Goodea atripinnis]|uniref:Secreted protein n=1 Tax=Goodea atripinnis TaxID=208336 RepID=A0ABV0NNY4_9TELE